MAAALPRSVDDAGRIAVPPASEPGRLRASPTAGEVAASRGRTKSPRSGEASGIRRMVD
ncbi:hypothetical protein [Plantibacter sp. YIM 135347]|uniref:hypothetical protein n=1 Tax=Plantibacter sp. YIM 135347 TaxID=3423919 RepID=UPI003D32B3BC